MFNLSQEATLIPFKNRVGETLQRLIFFTLPIAAVIVLLDQVSKDMVISTIPLHQKIVVIPGFFDLTFTLNKGAAFGMMAGIENDLYRHLLIAATTTMALTAVFFFLVHDYYKNPVAEAALSLIIGGAIGNVVDRFSHGAVVDFLDFYVGDLHWPTFNIADMAVCCGVAILLCLRPVDGSGPILSDRNNS